MTKKCRYCDSEMKRPQKVSYSQWERQYFCSKRCANLAGACRGAAQPAVSREYKIVEPVVREAIGSLPNKFFFSDVCRLVDASQGSIIGVIKKLRDGGEIEVLGRIGRFSQYGKTRSFKVNPERTLSKCHAEALALERAMRNWAVC